MPGFELVGNEEFQEIQKLFEKTAGNLYRYGPNNYAVSALEKAFAELFGVKYAYAVSSGTAAIHCALASAGIGPGDEVITTSFTFVAPIETIVALGATPVPVEIDETYHLDPEAVRAAITPKTKAVVSIPMWAPPKMEQIQKICEEANVLLIEDSAQCLGGKLNGKRLGTFGSIASFSFDMGKTLTVGEGGMVITDDRELYDRAAEFSDHGHMHDPSVPRGQDPVRKPGLNYRMNEVSGAIGLAQIKKLDTILETQRKNKQELAEALSDISVIEFRASLENSEETGDTLIFSLPDAKQAKAFVDQLTQEGVGSKILPEAFGWHYAGSWKHIFTQDKGYPEDLKTLWPKTYERLSRSVALAISVKMTSERISEVSRACHKAAEAIS